jgi:sodium-dependent phosphate cotransporter
MKPDQRVLLKIVAVAGLMYMFFVGLDMMGLSFKLFGGDFAEKIIQTTSNPFLGLCVGVLATSLVQSSSTTTSIAVAMVGAGVLSIEGAIPIVMGANIGTSVTNTLVSLGHVSRKEEFRRAFAGATVHDFFNWIVVLILLPLEIAFGYLYHVASFFEKLLEGAGGLHLLNPLKLIVAPVAKLLSDLLLGSGLLTLTVGVALIFVALRYLVTFLKSIMASRAEEILHRTLFRSAVSAVIAGALITTMVQSSSVTTSVIVPLVGAGVLTLEQAFPFTIGANIGTTVTAMLAALSLGNPSAVTVAFAHLFFNLSGGLLVYCIAPVRRIPLALARRMGDVAARSRLAAIAYTLLVFFGVPLLLLFVTGSLN